MDKSEIILITGIIIPVVWLFFCVFLEGKKRKRAITVGIVLDIILFIICRNSQMLLIGIIGGLVFGLAPGLAGSVRKYKNAVHEMKGIKNFVVVSMIFFVMIFMAIAIAYPGLEVVLR